MRIYLGTLFARVLQRSKFLRILKKSKHLNLIMEPKVDNFFFSVQGDMLCLSILLYFFLAGIYGGYLLGVKSSTSLTFYEWDSLRLVRRIEIVPKTV